jgi:hypothetical protein
MDFDKKVYIKNKINTYYKDKSKKTNIFKKLRQNVINENKQGGFSKIYVSIKRRIYNVFTENNLIFDMTYDEIIGCNKSKLEIYIINKLNNGMTIDNYPEWEIDHIYPVSKFDFTKKDNITACFNYKNLQPLWKSENRKKSNKIII